MVYKKVSWRVPHGASRGFTLVEIAIAIVVIGFLAGSVLASMTVVFNMQTRQDQKRIAEYLTRNEFEIIKTLPYSWGNETGNARPDYYALSLTMGIPPVTTQDYWLDVVAIPINGNSTDSIPDYSEQPLLAPDYQHVDDQGIQKVTIYVYSGLESSKPLLVTTNYKVAR